MELSETKEPGNATRAAGVRRFLLSDAALLLSIALLKIVAHMLISTNYGYFRDELYYIAAGRHLAFGYVDLPPLAPALAALMGWLFGDSLVSLHLLTAVAGAVLVLLTGLMARELGGGRFAQCLAALASLVSLTFLGTNSLFSYDSFDALWWVLCAYVLMRLIKQEQPKLWLLFGCVAGIGVMTKLTMLIFAFVLIVGLLLTPTRRCLFNRWLVLGGVVALLLALPYLWWEVTNGWPSLEFYSHYGAKTYPVTPVEFLLQQVLTMNPLTVPIWLSGLYFYLFTSRGRHYAVFGWAFIILYVLFTISHAKFYFLAPAYPPLFAAGACVIAGAIQRRGWQWIKPVYVILLLLSGLLLAPEAMPILPPATYIQVNGGFNGNASVKQERLATGALPQQFADRFGWDTMAATVARVYHRLPASEQRQACIFASNYGEAGAIDFFGPAAGLPHAISGHNSYYLWGPGTCTGEVVISIGVPLNNLQRVFSNVQQAAINTCVYCMPYENNLPIYVSRQPKQPLKDIWPTVKTYT